jgi:hypothetical protein
MLRIAFPSRRLALPLLFSALALVVASKSARAAFIETSFGGTSPASILPFVDMFRTAIGGVNNGNNGGPLASGRREINWDGGGSTTASPAGVPFNGFANNRGAIFNTPGTAFLQTPLDATEFVSIDPSYQTNFATFSDLRIFTPINSNITDVTFAIPGSNGLTPATVTAFGAVFSDVDVAGATKIEFYDVSNALLDAFEVPVGGVTTAGATLSFLGARSDSGQQIARVRIVTGNQALDLPDSNGNPVDVVVMDDFIYSEPAEAIPEPGSASLALITLLGGAGWVRRRSA